MATDYQPTYWYHPESSSYFIIRSQEEEDNLADGADGALCYQLDGEFQYITGLLKRIDEDPTHTLPQDIVAVIKLAAWHTAKDGKNHVSGAIWYDTRKRFVDGYMINAIPGCKREPGGIVTTASGDRYLCEIVQELKHG